MDERQRSDVVSTITNDDLPNPVQVVRRDMSILYEVNIFCVLCHDDFKVRVSHID